MSPITYAGRSRADARYGADRKKATRLLTVALFGAFLVSCGAATALDFDPPSKGAEKPSSGAPAAPRPTPEVGGNSGGGGQSGIDLPTFELPDCTLGARPNTVAECPYLAEGLCYNDVESACACVCSRQEDSFCFEGLFLNIWNGVDVTCSKR